MKIQIDNSGIYANGNPIGSMDFYKCAVINQKNWSGYKAILIDGQYQFQDNLTEYLTYGEAYIPEIGKIYNNNATIKSEPYNSLTNGLIFYASLDNNHTNISQTENDLTNINVNYTTKDNIKCAYFNGSSYIYINQPLEITLPHLTKYNQISYSAYFRVENINKAQQIISCTQNGGFSIGINSDSNTGYVHLYLKANNQYLNTNVCPISNIKEKKWTFICVNYNGTKCDVWINDEKVFTVNKSGYLNYPQNSPLVIGAQSETLTNQQGTSDLFKGYISNIRIYNRFLSDNVINKLYNNLISNVIKQIEYLDDSYTGDLNVEITFGSGNNAITVNQVVPNISTGIWGIQGNNVYCLCGPEYTTDGIWIYNINHLGNIYGHTGYIGERYWQYMDFYDVNYIEFDSNSRIPLNVNLVEYKDSIINNGEDADDFPTSVIITKKTN